MTDVRSFPVGPIQENAYIVRASAESASALLIDPGEEPQKLLGAADALGVKIEAILLTHCHFDHIGAVAPVAKATGAPVYCPEIETPLLADVMRWVPPGFGPFESWDPEHTLKGGERLQLAGLDIEVIFTPGHSPGHLTYAIAPTGSSPQGPPAATGAQPPALLSGDVLFKGSVGRVDLPGGDWATLERSIATLMERFPAQSVVHPGHMGMTTLGAELQSNPFLTELRAGAALALPAQHKSTTP
jgi:glyoxylase-like metal-dependent hydrolase (beta-lactamase superfamily II)